MNGDVTFIRIPKNASTSLYSFFGKKNAIRNELFSADNSKYMNVFESSHRAISDAVENLGDCILNNPVLAVVRNPFDRFVSMFFFARRYNLGSLYDIKTNDFDEFAEGFYKLKDDDDFFHAMPQRQYILHDDCEGFTVVRFEHLSEGITQFLDKNELGDNFDKNMLEKLNSTTHSHYSDYYSKKSKEIVNNMWGCDLEMFGYEFSYE